MNSDHTYLHDIKTYYMNGDSYVPEFGTSVGMPQQRPCLKSTYFKNLANFSTRLYFPLPNNVVIQSVTLTSIDFFSMILLVRNHGHLGISNDATAVRL